MPYKSIEDAKKAKFPTTIDGAPLTLAQINQLAKVYDAVKKAGSADEPMAVSITQFKKSHKKSDGSWVSGELVGAEVSHDNYDPLTHVVKAIKIGTVAHTDDGFPFECTAEWLEAHATDWQGGAVIANHNGPMSERLGDITRSWWESPFVLMEIGNMHVEAEKRMLANEHTGFSFDAVGYPDDPNSVFGTDLSLLFFPHFPACPATEGCGLASESLSHNIETDVKTKDIQKHIGSEAMDNKEYSSAEIESMKAEAADVAAELATLKAEAKTHDTGVAALRAELAERTDKISEMTEKAGEMFSAEDVEAKVTETKGTMFSAEDVEAAKTEAITEAIAAEKAKMETIAAEIDAVNKMFPDGLAAEFREEVVAMIMDGKTHDALLKVGQIEFRELKANIPSGSGGEGIKDPVIESSIGAGVYNPVTGAFTDVGE
jgi:hypothetical protein